MLSSNLKKLIALEERGSFVFHGGGLKLHGLEPRQAYTIVNGVNQEDGPPAIFASALIDYAIFMAVINYVNCPKGARSRCSYEDGVLLFGSTQESLDQLTAKSKGYVHVFDRHQFEHRGGCEYRSFQSVEPCQILVVRFADFRPAIEVMKPGPKEGT